MMALMKVLLKLAIVVLMMIVEVLIETMDYNDSYGEDDAMMIVMISMITMSITMIVTTITIITNIYHYPLLQPHANREEPTSKTQVSLLSISVLPNKQFLMYRWMVGNIDRGGVVVGWSWM